MTDLIDLLESRSGIVCAVGAGGKKSTLYALAAAHAGRVAFTTTVHTLPPPDDLFPVRVLEPPDALPEALGALRDALRVAYACPGDKPGRWAGVPPELLVRLHEEARFALTLVKADGARMRWVKAPAADEPVVPPGTHTLIPVLSARALGEPLAERIAHHPRRVAERIGIAPGAPLDPLAAARLLAGTDGLLKGAGTAHVVPVINMVDDPERERLARETAEAALGLTSRFERVILARMQRRDDPVVAVVRR